jgi:hypothetical protein
MHRRFICLQKAAFMAAYGLLFVAGAAQAQPTIRFGAIEPFVFEGNPGGPPVTLNFKVELSAVSSQPVTALFSTGEFGGVTRSVSGPNCSTANQPGGVDFIRVVNQLVTIPANADPPEVIVPVTVCPDTLPEVHTDQFGVPHTAEALIAILTEAQNAFLCQGTGCLTRAQIGDDDAAPSASANGVTLREPLSGSRTMTFTVTLSHPHPGFEARVNWATRNGTAVARPGACNIQVIGGGGPPDYFSGSGTLVFAPNDMSENLSVTICSDSITEPTENFFIDLTGGVNVGSVSGGVGSILDFQLLFTGDPTLAPDSATVDAGEWLPYRFGWTVTSGVWRDLKSLDLRFRDPDTGKIPLWIRWLERGNTFQVCEVPGHSDDSGDARDVKCGEAVVAGSPQVLRTPLASLDLAGTKTTGSGPTGPSVVLDLLVNFKNGAAKGTYDVEVASETDAGLGDDFIPAGVLTIVKR